MQLFDLIVLTGVRDLFILKSEISWTCVSWEASSKDSPGVAMDATPRKAETEEHL